MFSLDLRWTTKDLELAFLADSLASHSLHSNL